jgi:hypothetical protein
MIDAIFDLGVWLLHWLADLLGMTYQAVNVWVFVVIWPLFTLALLAVVIAQQMRIRRLQRIGEPMNQLLSACTCVHQEERQ